MPLPSDLTKGKLLVGGSRCRKPRETMKKKVAAFPRFRRKKRRKVETAGEIGFVPLQSVHRPRIMCAISYKRRSRQMSWVREREKEKMIFFSPSLSLSARFNCPTWSGRPFVLSRRIIRLLDCDPIQRRVRLHYARAPLSSALEKKNDYTPLPLCDTVPFPRLPASGKESIPSPGRGENSLTARPINDRYYARSGRDGADGGCSSRRDFQTRSCLRTQRAVIAASSARLLAGLDDWRDLKRSDLRLAGLLTRARNRTDPVFALFKGSWPPLRVKQSPGAPASLNETSCPLPGQSGDECCLEMSLRHRMFLP